MDGREWVVIATPQRWGQAGIEAVGDDAAAQAWIAAAQAGIAGVGGDNGSSCAGGAQAVMKQLRRRGRRQAGSRRWWSS